MDNLNLQQEYQMERFNKSLERISNVKLEKSKGKYIYVLKCDKYYKIGIASNINSRLNTLQCGNPFEIEVILATRNAKAKELEKALHDAFIEFKHKREWFMLENDFVEKLKVFIETYE